MANNSLSVTDSNKIDISDKLLDNHTIIYHPQSTSDQISNIIRMISQLNTQRQRFGKLLRAYSKGIISSLNTGLPSTFSHQTVYKEIKRIKDLNGLTIGGIDGGLVKRTFTGIDIIGYRSCGVTFTYGPSSINHTYYYPSKNPPIQLFASDTPYSLYEADQLGSQLRATLEIETAINLLKKNPKKIDFLLMDGSYNDLYDSRNNEALKTDLLFKQRYLDQLHDLKEEAHSKGTTIGWIVKDSRLRQFNLILKEKLPDLIKELPELINLDSFNLLENTYDQALMSYILPAGSRSFILPKRDVYFDSLDSTKLISGFSYYLKTNSFDVPLRIDFFNPDSLFADEALVFRVADRLATIALILSEFHPMYSFPTPLIEADARSRISNIEFQMLMDSIHQRIPNCIETMNLRRSRSPFKFS